MSDEVKLPHKPARGYSYPKKVKKEVYIYFPTKAQWFNKNDLVKRAHELGEKFPVLLEEEIKFLIGEKFQPIQTAIGMLGIKQDEFDDACTKVEDFADSINQAASMTVANALNNLMTVPRGWERYAWILERLFPEQFAKPTDRDHDKAFREDAKEKKQLKLVAHAKLQYEKLKEATANEKRRIAENNKQSDKVLQE